MFKQLFSLFPILLIFTILFLPLILIDITIIYFMEGYYSKLINLILFLVIFYIADLVLGIFIDSLLKIISDFDFIRVNINNLISGVFDFLGSYIVISILDNLFNTVNLSIGIRILIVFIHSLLVFLINNFQTEKDKQDDYGTTDKKLTPSIEYEINYLLQKENMVTCINLIKKKYPELPKETIIKTVRKINNENK
jgi:hypothetical protein